MWEIHEEAWSMKKDPEAASHVELLELSAEKEVPKGLRILDSH